MQQASSTNTTITTVTDYTKKLIVIIGMIIVVCAILTLAGWSLYRKFKKGQSHVVKSVPE